MAKKTAMEPASSTFRVTADYVFTSVSAWLLPGAGHWFLGYRVRAIVLGASILGLFWVGEALAVPVHGDGSTGSPMAVVRQVNPVFFYCQIGNGFSTLIAQNLWGKPGKDALDPIDRDLPRYLNLGILMTSVSGLLNLLVVLHVLDPRTWAQAAADKAVKPTPTGGAP